jgi:hypothetical protein
MLPPGIMEGPEEHHLVDLDRLLRELFYEYGHALNDDLISIPDWVRTIPDGTNYVMLPTDHIILAYTLTTPMGITLPLSADAEPRIYAIKKTAANAVLLLIGRQGSDLIDGSITPISITVRYDLALLVPDRVSNWYLLHSGTP